MVDTDALRITGRLKRATQRLGLEAPGALVAIISAIEPKAAGTLARRRFAVLPQAEFIRVANQPLDHSALHLAAANTARVSILSGTPAGNGRCQERCRFFMLRFESVSERPPSLIWKG